MTPLNQNRLTSFLGRAARSIGLRRITGTGGSASATTVLLPGFVRTQSATGLQGTTVQHHRTVRVTARDLAAAAWPDAPKVGDFVVIDGQAHRIEQVEPLYLAKAAVFYLLSIRG